MQTVPDEYTKLRNDLVANDTSRRYGNTTELSEDEQKIDHVLRELIQKETEEFIKSGRSISEINFIHAKEHIDQSPVYRIIRKMPKGNKFLFEMLQF